jgi:predicted alpha-1,6-mannanase (GH76 family)
MLRKLTTVALIGAIALCALSQPNPVQAAETAQERATLAVKAMQKWYNIATGVWETTGWWNSANAMYVLADYTIKTGDETYLKDFQNTYALNIGKRFLNNFYDDEGWWVLAWIRVYELTKNEKYLQTAKDIFADMITAWDDTCGGGLWWTKDREYKNAIPNELFLQAAARLHNLTPDDTFYLDWAQRTWKWFKASGMINAQNLINDGLKDCKNNEDITWTYNQGVILGGLVELHKATGDQTLLDQAEAIADAAIKTLVNEDGILREPCELSGKCGADGPQFKGIFMRNLGFLYEATRKSAYADFIRKNADSIWTNARNADNQIGLKWYAKFDLADAARQSSAIEALLAALIG